ncbi:hypothetical protein FB472_1854 [Rhodoglobus vestalii]|uniref:Uncharacterized protein n=1 Tax=Rhodoglobus vestalii TaxID=193384 RepID=A0A8H2K798_9MICO|nr:hypothetical protein [Rhodoglobus vestalii]TQO20234.1 hypothetical protein FB472_1854 [Rhodoglobus vestalii]
MPFYLPALSQVVLAIATPRRIALSPRRLITSLKIVVALRVAYVLILQPFATFGSA